MREEGEAAVMLLEKEGGYYPSNSAVMRKTVTWRKITSAVENCLLDHSLFT